MKKFITVILTAAFTICLAQAEEETLGEKTSEAWDKTKQKTKEVSRKVVNKTKETAKAVESYVTAPDADARRVKVKLNDRGVQMPGSIQAGKTAFMVTNSGKEKHNFEIEGKSLDKSFWLSLPPGGSKIMQIDLKPGIYEVDCPLQEHADKETKAKLTVK